MKIKLVAAWIGLILIATAGIIIYSLVVVLTALTGRRGLLFEAIYILAIKVFYARAEFI